MKLRVPDISDEEGLDLDIDALDTAWFGRVIEETFGEDHEKGSSAVLKINLLRTCENVSLNGNAAIDLSPSCDRCLEIFKRHVEVPLHVDMAPYKEINFSEGEETEIDAEDVNFSFYKGEEIDLAEIVREILLLEIPFRYLCSESCKGLCPKCGVNLNTGSCSCVLERKESQFAILKDLIKR